MGTKHSADGEAAVGEEQGRSWLSQEQSLSALGFCFKELFPRVAGQKISSIGMQVKKWRNIALWFKKISQGKSEELGVFDSWHSHWVLGSTVSLHLPYKRSTRFICSCMCPEV